MAICVNNVHIDLAFFTLPRISITFSDIHPIIKNFLNPSILSWQPICLNFNPALLVQLWCEPDLLDKDIHWAPRTNLPPTSSGLRSCFATATTRIGSTLSNLSNQPPLKPQLETSHSYLSQLFIHSLAKDQCVCSRETLVLPALKPIQK